MKSIETIINTALLGTATKEINLTDFPEELQKTIHKIQERNKVSESAFYQIAALGFAFQKAGLSLQKNEKIFPYEEAPSDNKSYFSNEATELLLSLHESHNQYLMLYAYQQAIKCNKLLQPYNLQRLINRAFDRNNPMRHEEQLLLSRLSGNRGRWLLSHMELPDWGEAESENWETASHEVRIHILRNLRQKNPTQGLELLRSEFKNESASHRDKLIQCLQINLTKADESFLQKIMETDRSSNVKETARKLLCSLPDSQLVQTYRNLLQGKLHYNILMGWSYDKIEITSEMKEIGLEEVSSYKNEKDDRFLLRQLAERVPLDFWCEFYNCNKEKSAAKLAKNPPFPKLFSLWETIINFRDSLWAYHTLKENNDENMLISLIELLSPEQREELNLQIKKGNNYIPDTWFNQDNKEWGMKFAHYTFQRLTSDKTYFIQNEIAERLAIYYPSEMISILEKSANKNNPEEGTAKYARKILEYMTLKQKINTLFS